jgi:hypothetical protein
MTEQEKREKLSAYLTAQKAERTKRIVLQEAAKDLKNGKMSESTYEIFKKKNS